MGSIYANIYTFSYEQFKCFGITLLLKDKQYLHENLRKHPNKFLNTYRCDNIEQPHSRFFFVIIFK